MINEHIATYLNDHLAGSVVVLELLEHLEAAHAGTDVARFAAEMRREVTEDRQELASLMRRLRVAESAGRRATAWLAEKATEIKLRIDDRADGSLRLLEALDAVAVGIEGKRALWTALAAATEPVPELRGVDYDKLASRAEAQHSRVEAKRLEAAKIAFTVAA